MYRNINPGEIHDYGDTKGLQGAYMVNRTQNWFVTIVSWDTLVAYARLLFLPCFLREYQYRRWRDVVNDIRWIRWFSSRQHFRLYYLYYEQSKHRVSTRKNQRCPKLCTSNVRTTVGVSPSCWGVFGVYGPEPFLVYTIRLILSLREAGGIYLTTGSAPVFSSSILSTNASTTVSVLRVNTACNMCQRRTHRGFLILSQFSTSALLLALGSRVLLGTQ